ncbi:unnamed protein product [Brassica oleracea]
MISENKTNVGHLSISITEGEQSGDHSGGDLPNMLKSSIRSSSLTKNSSSEVRNIDPNVMGSFCCFF